MLKSEKLSRAQIAAVLHHSHLLNQCWGHIIALMVTVGLAFLALSPVYTVPEIPRCCWKINIFSFGTVDEIRPDFSFLQCME